MAQNRAFAGTAAAVGTAAVAGASDTAGMAGRENTAASDWRNLRLFMALIYEVLRQLRARHANFRPGHGKDSPSLSRGLVTAQLDGNVRLKVLMSGKGGCPDDT